MINTETERKSPWVSWVGRQSRDLRVVFVALAAICQVASKFVGETLRV